MFSYLTLGVTCSAQAARVILTEPSYEELGRNKAEMSSDPSNRPIGNLKTHQGSQTSKEMNLTRVYSPIRELLSNKSYIESKAPVPFYFKRPFDENLKISQTDYQVDTSRYHLGESQHPVQGDLSGSPSNSQSIHGLYLGLSNDPSLEQKATPKPRRTKYANPEEKKAARLRQVREAMRRRRENVKNAIATGEAQISTLTRHIKILEKKNRRLMQYIEEKGLALEFENFNSKEEGKHSVSFLLN